MSKSFGFFRAVDDIRNAALGCVDKMQKKIRLIENAHERDFLGGLSEYIKTRAMEKRFADDGYDLLIRKEHYENMVECMARGDFAQKWKLLQDDEIREFDNGGLSSTRYYNLLVAERKYIQAKTGVGCRTLARLDSPLEDLPVRSVKCCG